MPFKPPGLNGTTIRSSCVGESACAESGTMTPMAMVMAMMPVVKYCIFPHHLELQTGRLSDFAERLHVAGSIDQGVVLYEVFVDLKA